ncbi:WD repeat-containing protein 90 isoform X2 [Nerophis lumbriciformis]|uniref:WD repeat-containing protein 90 isoform X2 n=1 Tax=Nerophis lumbriciformis TaxID=546530 RepID=UPI002ADF1E0E|nr:WD repeat-containing protein 90 isoform X2 [Nerophis lumbriciformis]
MASKAAWQEPFVNIFKHFRVGEWKKASKGGDVSTYTDKTLNCSVFRIKGSVPTIGYILVPKNTSQSMGLTGRYFYLLFNPSQGKSFSIVLDVIAEDGRVVRISISNMFKEFKSTPTSLCLPFLCGSDKDMFIETKDPSRGQVSEAPSPSQVRWTCLMMDLQETLSTYLNQLHFKHLKNVKLCAYMSVKNMFTTNMLLNPELSYHDSKQLAGASSEAAAPMPRDMAFPVPKGQSWLDLYHYFRFPPKERHTDIKEKDKKKNEARSTRSLAVQEKSQPVVSSIPELGEIVTEQTDHIVDQPKNHTRSRRNRRPATPSCNTEDGGADVFVHQRADVHTEQTDHIVDQPKNHTRTRRNRRPSTPSCNTEDGGAHVFVHQRADVHKHHGETDEYVESPLPHPVWMSISEDTKEQKLLPDPILRLRRIIGFGGATTKCALWTRLGDAVVYPCHAIVISMKIDSNEQRFFIGHTDKVSALAFNGNSTMLASAQTGNYCVVRVWNYLKGNCLAMFRMQAQSVTSLSFSYSGGFLCGVGKDNHGKTLVVVWNTVNVSNGGEVSILAKTKTDVDITTMKVANFDDTRLVSCGHDNIRLWRVRSGILRSCPINLSDYKSLDFTDVAFEEGDSPDQHLDDRTLFASSQSGHIFEIDYTRVVIRNVRWLFPMPRQEKLTLNKGHGIAINSISVSPSFCATGSEDGYLRLWPLDFSGVFLEAEHEGPVSVVSISSDSMQVLAATSTGNMGFLDVTSRGYNTLMRSHTDTVLGFSVDGIRRHLTTASSDGTVRIWSMDSLHQLYDFVSEDRPCSVAFHPSEQIFSCGFNSGIVRVFDLSCGKLMVEHNDFSGEVVGLAFSPDGSSMYSAGSEGSLARYSSSGKGNQLIKVVCGLVARGTGRAPDALTVSSDSHCLAFVGPSEYTVTIANAVSLEESLRVDVSILDVDSNFLDSALKVCFSSASPKHLLVATSANKILWVDTKTGCLLRQVTKVHKHWCSSLAVSEDRRFLVTAGHISVKVWDYNMQLKTNSQMFIGHSQPINQVSFTPGQLGVVSVGDAIFLWDFLAQPMDLLLSNCSRPSSSGEVQACNELPRQSAPLPFSPPPPVDISAMDTQEFEQDVTVIGSDPSCNSKPATSFLKITEPSDVTNLNTCLQGFSTKKPVRPDCYRHFIPRFNNSTLDETAVTPQASEAAMKLKAVIGYNGNGRGNMVWSPDQGLFAYSCGGVVVVEYLNSGRQRHLQGHNEEISCLAISNDAKIMASAAIKCNSSSLICIWDIQSGDCLKTISYHRGAVQCLAFSKDDCFFLSVGDFTDPMVALWSSKTLQMLSGVTVSVPIHDAAFCPSAPAQLACVGRQSVYFGLIQSDGQDVELKVMTVRAPAEVGDVEMTAVCYHTDSLLFTATNRGHLCVWDIKTQTCFMTWEADEGEIGILLCRGNSLLTGSNTHWLRLWEVEAVLGMKPQAKAFSSKDSGKSVVLKQEIMLDGTTVSAAFDNTMDMGIVGTTAGTLWYIDWLDNSNIRLVSGHKNKVNDLAFHPNESHFATCSEDGSLRVWSFPANELVVQFQVLGQSCNCVCWSPFPSEQRISVAAGYGDGTLRIFRLATAEMERKLQPHCVAVTAIQYSANGDVIISGGKNGLIAVSNAKDGTTIRILKDHKGAAVSAIQCVNEQCKDFGMVGNELWLAASADRRISVWAADWFTHNCALLDWLTLPAPPYRQDDSPPPSLASFCPTDPSLVVYTSYGIEKDISFYSLSKKRIIKKIAMPHWATCFSLSSKSQLIALGSKERVLKLIEWTSGKFQDFLQHSDALQTSRFSPSGKLLFSVAHNEIFLWEVQGL